jgi:D-alanine--poly(phosphoribitol) ligase subunit 2
MLNMKHDPITIKEKIKSYIQQATHVDSEKIQDDSLFFKEGYLDSMGFIMLITFIEDEFAFKTSDADLIEENFESINAITSYILRKSENQ